MITETDTEILISNIMEDMCENERFRLNKATRRVDLCGCGSCQHELRQEFDRADYITRRGIYLNDPGPDDDHLPPEPPEDPPLNLPSPRKRKRK